MRAFLRRCRGALGISIAWGAVWAAIFAALTVVIGIVDPDSIDPGETVARIAWIGGVFGLVSGAVFSLLLSLAERRKTIRDLSLRRAALWGVVGAWAVYRLAGRVMSPGGAVMAAAC